MLGYSFMLLSCALYFGQYLCKNILPMELFKVGYSMWLGTDDICLLFYSCHCTQKKCFRASVRLDFLNVPLNFSVCSYMFF